MEAIVNGERRSLPGGTRVADLLRELDLGGRRIAVEINRDIVPKGEYETRAIEDGDEIEVVHFVGGG